MKEQVKYWLNKYTPNFFSSFIIKKIDFFSTILIGYKYTKFETQIKNNARNAGISYYASLDDDEAYFNNDLLEKSLTWLSKANEIELSYNNNKPGYQFYNQFPGEWYRFLAGVCLVEKPTVAIDIGTFTGMSSRVLLDYSKAKVLTIDLNDWQGFDSYLNIDDFNSRRISQSLLDVSVPKNFDIHQNTFKNSDLILLDGPKNAIFEEKILDLLSQLDFPSKKRYLVVDDIRYPEMFNFWRIINSPKIDLSSLVHWSGTGVVDISNGIVLKKSL